ncbi:MAG: glycerophosphodiester phosphodiesterase [Chloroflexota bacterium]
MIGRLVLALALLAGITGAVYAAEDGEDTAPEEPTAVEAIPFFNDDDGILVMAHQGGDGLRPGNTMAAFEHAVELGVDVLEMDIHSTADGVLVVIHDDTIDRTTDGSGRVQDFTFEEIQQFDAGYNWPTLSELADIEDHPFRGQGITIPALEAVLQAFPEMRMNIEIKQEEPSIAGALCDLLREYDMTEQVLIASFSQVAMNDFREVCPEVATSGVEVEIRGFYVRSLGDRLEGYETPARAWQVPEFTGELQVITPEFISAARSVGLAVHVWTPNTRDDLARMIEADVDGIITDFPDILLDLLGRSADAEE